MAVLYEMKERRVIPNWRDYKRTLLLGELNESNKKQDLVLFNINRSIEDWKLEKNIGTAADLVNSSFVSGIINPSVHEAIEYIKSDNLHVSKSLLDLAQVLEKETQNGSSVSNNSLLEVDVETINEFQAFINNETFHRIINKTKNRSKNELRNPIIWIELARLHSMRGNEDKAENAVLTALHLAPNNRFVLRSATRFFIHNGKFDKALFFLRKSPRLKSDPWLISAHIATSSIMKRYSPLINTGKSMIDSNSFSDYELTELSSSIGTLEFNSGSFKKAKSYFQRSMRMPNDNSLAQIEWISKDETRLRIDPFKFKHVINPFEARALELFERGNWNEAFYNTIKWFLDIPFSKRPAILGSYIAGSLLKDTNAALILCQVGLQANPKDPVLLNNLVYYSATSKEGTLPEHYLRQMMDVDISQLSEERSITYQATLGLVALKNEKSELGIKYYKNAIQKATDLKNDYLKNLAIINFTNELIAQNLPEKDEYINVVKEMKLETKHKDLLVLREDVLKKLQN